jgi:PAS domain S-box-containing protein
MTGKDVHAEMRILLVDRCAAARCAFHATFTDSNVAVRIIDCESAEQALSMIAGGACGFDVIVAEQDLPGRSGLQFYHDVSGRMALPFIMLTSAGDERLAVEALNLGVSDYLPKSGDTYAADVLPSAVARVVASYRDRAERQQANVALRGMEERFQLLIEAVADYAIFMLDAGGHVASWNSGARRITGYSTAEILGAHLSAFYSDDDVQNDEPNEALRIAATEGKYEAEGWRVRRDGSKFWSNDSVSAVRDRQGRLCGFANVTRDFTERKRTQQRIERSEARLARAQRIAHLASWNLELRTDRLEWCDELYRIIGRCPNEVTPSYRALLSSIHLDDQRAFESQMRRSISKNETTIADYRVVRKTGEVRDVCSEICLESSDDGRPQRLIGTIHDITERKREEVKARFLYETTSSALVAAIQDYDKTLLELAGLAVPFFADWCLLSVMNEEGTVQRTLAEHALPGHNTTFEQLQLRLDRDRTTLRPTRQAILEGRPVLIRDALPEDLVDETTQTLLSIIKSLQPRSLIAVPLLIQDRLIGSLTFVSSHSGRMFRPSDLSFANSLAQRSAIAIENARVYEEVREADRRKDEFLATLAHELRNPLAPVRNALEVLKLAHGDATLTEKARMTIERQIEYMVRLVDDLLDLSHIMRGKINLRKERVALDAIVHRALETTAPQINTHNHELLVQLPPFDMWLEGDEVRLAQVVANLLSNAAKYTDSGGHIWLDAQLVQDQLEIRVRDDGIGMHPKMLSRIFDLFQQIDSSLERSHGGLGIGLTLVRRLVEMHGGTVSAFSEGKGHGSEFVIRLPLPVAATSGNGVDALPGAGAAPGSSGIRILVVDDNVDAAEMLVDLLRLEGHEVSVAFNGEEALPKARQFAPQTVLLDIGLPGINGYEVARQLRQFDETKESRLIAITGFGQDLDRLRTKEAGFDYHLVKPVSPDELRRILTCPVDQMTQAFGLIR